MEAPIFRTNTVTERGDIDTDCFDVVFINQGGCIAYANGMPINPGQRTKISSANGQLMKAPIRIAFVGAGEQKLLIIRDAGDYDTQQLDYAYIPIGELEFVLNGAILELGNNAPTDYRRCRMQIKSAASALADDNVAVFYRYGAAPTTDQSLTLGLLDVIEFTASEIAVLQFDQAEAIDIKVFVEFYG